MSTRRPGAGALSSAVATSAAGPRTTGRRGSLHGPNRPVAQPQSRRSGRRERDPHLALDRATWARDHALGLVAHLNAIGLRGEAAAAANIAGVLDGVLRELPPIPPAWRRDTPHDRAIP